MTKTFSTDTDLDLGLLFGSNVERTKVALDFYRDYYDLPKRVYEDDVTPQLFQYCKKRDFFVNILAYQNDRVFLKRAIGPRLGWELPGSAVQSRGNEVLQDAVARIIKRDIPSVEIGELRPIAYLEKTYICRGDKITHHGVTFMGRVRNRSPQEIEANEDIKGRFVHIDDTHEYERLAPVDKEIFKLGYGILKESISTPKQSIDDEIDSTKAIPVWAKGLHRYFIHPFGQWFSSSLIKKEILKNIAKNDFFLDVACGDDTFIYEMAQKAKFCVGNDVQWNQIQKLMQFGLKHKKNVKNVIFSNHDACALPFKKKFDLALCKNLVHHMDDKDQLRGLLESLGNVSHRILIIDPENPATGPLRAKHWHWYYVNVLKDQGEKFHSRELFENTLREFFADAKSITVNVIRTIKGNYMFGLIDLGTKIDNDQHDEVKPSRSEIIVDRDRSAESIKAVIFDLDGLLVDTESLFISAIRTVLQREGIQFHAEDYVNMDLQNGKSFLEHLYHSGVVRDIERVQREIYVAYERFLLNKVEPMPGALMAVNQLKNHYRLAIASSSKRRFIDQILDHLGLSESFEVIIGREDTKHVKPDPECLLKVVSQLGLQPKQCVLVEDSLRGMKAAQAVGMACIVVPNTLTKNADYSGSDLKLSSLEELTVDSIKNMAHRIN